MAERDNRPTVVTYQGANGRTLSISIKKDDGTAYDLTGMTVALKAVLDGATKINYASMTVSTPSNGVATYTPSAGEIDDVGIYVSQIRMTSGGLYDYTEPFNLDVRAVV